MQSRKRSGTTVSHRPAPWFLYTYGFSKSVADLVQILRVKQPLGAPPLDPLLVVLVVVQSED